MGKSYRAARDAQVQKPIEFDIEGEEFSISRPLPGFILLDFAELADAEGAEAVQAFGAFFRQCLKAEDYKRFRKVCTEKRVPLKANLDDGEMADDELSLLRIAQDIISEDAGRPTQQRSDSPEPQQVVGISSAIGA